jgi:fibronectin-binding autotransporter adhesin
MAVVTWDGSTDTDYGTAANWDTGSVPTSSDDVIIANVANDCVLDGSRSVKSFVVQAGGDFNGNAETLTVVGENGSGYAVDIDGDIVGTNTMITITTPATTAVDFNPTSGAVRDLTINNGGNTITLTDPMTLSRNLTITAGELDTASDRDLTVTGDCYVAGTLTGNASAISLGSLEVAASGTYNATTGTTTITDEDSVTGYTWDVNGTFNNNDGGVTFDLGSGVDSHIRTGQSDGANSFHNLTVLLNASTNTLTMRPNAGTVMTIEGNLTISEGVLQKNTHSHTLTVTGNVEIHAGGKIDATSASGAMNMGSLTIDAGGTYLATSGTTTITNKASSNFAFKNSGTFTHNSGTMQIGDGSTSTGGAHIMNTTYHNLIINRDQNAPDGNTPWRPSSGTEVTIAGNLTVTKGRFYRNSSSNSLVVTGDVDIAANGQVGTSAASGSNTFGSLTIASGGTYLATSGTTEITSAASNYAVTNNGTLTHNDGTFQITGGSNQWLRGTGSGAYYNLISNNGSSLGMGVGANLSVANDLTINASKKLGYTGPNYTITVTRNLVCNGSVATTTLPTAAHSFGSLTIASGGTWQATSGVTDITSNTGEGSSSALAFSQMGSGVFTHNNGTVKFSLNADYAQIISGSSSVQGPFYDVDHNRASASYHLYIKSDMTVEHDYDNVQGYTTLYGPKTLTLGENVGTPYSGSYKATGSGLRFYDNDSSNYAKVYGASVTTPFVYTGVAPDIDTYSTNASYTAWKWGDIQVNLTGDYQGGTLRLDGDMEFDAVTVNSGDTLDLNGQRAVFGGAFDLTTGALAMNDSMAVFTNTIDFNGRVPTSNTGTTIIHNPPSTSEKLITSLYFGGTFFAQGAESDVNGYAWGGSSGEYPAKVFVGGQLDCQQSVKTTTTMQVATGGELRGNDRTITCEGDFTTSGGLIGKSAVLFDGTNDVGSAPSATASTTNPTDNLFVEAWWKSTNTTPETTSVIGKEDSYLLYINSSGYFQGYVYGSSSDISVSGGWMGSIFDQKWHHIAMGYSQAGGLKIWLDGRLVGYNATNAGTLNQNANGLRIMRYGSNYGQGTVAMGRIWTGAVPTDAQLRSNMFKGEADSPAYTSGVIQTAWYFDEGTGTTVEDVGVGTDADLLLEGSPAWAGAGTFTEGTSTVDMTGNGKTMCFNGDTEFYNLNVAASGKTTNIYNNLNVSSALYIVSGGTLTHGGGTFQVSGGSSGYYPKVVCQGTYTAGADFESLYTFYFVGQSVSNVQPAGKFNYLIYDNAYNGGTNYTTSLAGNITGSNYISIQDSCGLNTRSSGVDYNIDSSRMILKNSASLTLNSSTLKLTNTTGLDLSTTTNTFSAGPGCVISGSSAGTTFKSQNNFAVVGEIVNLNVTNEELKVTGQVINCTGDIHQYFPTIDHAQQLDADTADDRDVRLGRDLDKNTELINS